MGMAVDGLVTGMSTTDTVNQLIKVEALPQTALKNKVTAQGKMVTAYQNINSKFASLLTAAKALGSADTWGAMKATSNSDAAVVTTKTGASAGSLTFHVDSLAAAHTVTFSNMSVASTATQVAAGDVGITLLDGSSVNVTPTDGSLASVVAAINGEANAAYRAAAVQIGPGQYTLQLTAKSTGAAAAFAAPTGIDPAVLGAGVITTQGTNAVLSVGTTNPYQLSSATNTFADVLPGVTVTATRAQAPADANVTVSLTEDVEGIAGKVQAMVDAANAALTEIASQTKMKEGTTAGGALVGDSAVRKLSQQILSAVAGGFGALGTDSLSAVGIETTRDGKLTFDKTKFTEAYADDPAATQAYFDSYTNNSSVPVNPADPVAVKANSTAFQPGWDTANLGIARRLETIAVVATEGVVLPTDPLGKVKQGTLQGLIQRRNASIDALNDQVAEWDTRLELRRAMLNRQFSNLEVAMGKMQQQSTWLAGQLATLPTY
ncbi:MAG TPA: flagellar filament capping protein FliD [Actinoplanes sp.]|nr:flagellar filament capping protein FliD [Actinoplanes sp.]